MRLSVENVSFQYDNGNKRILNRFSMDLKSGERVGLMAPSGGGKTTLLKILAGYEKPDGGQVMVDGKPLTFYGRLCPVQLIWQHPEQAVNPRLRLGKTLYEGGVVSPHIITGLGIEEDWLNRFPGELSGGELQRFCIARALGDQTRFLLTDEITAMLDLMTQSQIWEFLLEEIQRRRMGLLVVSHSEGLMERICTRRIRMGDGRETK